MKRSILAGSITAALALGWSSTAASAVDMRMISTTSTPGFGGDQDMEIHSQVDGLNGRYEFISSEGNDMFSEGGYMLTMDGGNTVYLVNPAEMTYMVFDLSAIMGFAGGMMDAMGGAIEMSFENFSSNISAEESGIDMLGYSTTRYAIQTSYDMTMSVFGMNRSSTTATSTEVWCTDELGGEIFNPFQQATNMRTGIEGLDQMMQEQAQFAEDCAILRSVSTTTVDGQRGETVSEMRVTEISEVSGFPAATFEIPADYMETSFLDQMQGEMPEDSELPAGFPFGGGQSGGDSDDDDRPLRRLRGIFGGD
jgi:hypothetical protein